MTAAPDAASAEVRAWRAARSALLADTQLTGTAWCRTYADLADAWLQGVFDKATAGNHRGVALLAVGGYGRGELTPGSDLDLLLLYDRRGRISPVAEAVWYPVWDAGIRLDHSVRTPREVRALMEEDIKVALGLLDARCVAGDRGLADKTLNRALDLWETRLRRWLPLLDETTRARHQRFGDLAFLLEPDLKEARGGQRDLYLLRSLGRVVPILAEVLNDPALSQTDEVLAAARVELHRATGRAVNTLLLQDQDAVAETLDYADADALMAALAAAGRRVSWASDDGWRRLESWLAGPARRGASRDHPLEPGLVLRDNEVTLLADAPVAADSSLALRAAAASAELDLPLARTTLDRLANEATPPEGVWPPETLLALVRLLGAGRPAVAATEALDQCGIWVRYLPEWGPVRNRPQRNAYHRYTVDRHLVEAAAEAAALTGKVSRPDLLLLGALFHDIGKGQGDDHTAIGIEIVGTLAPRLGCPDADVTTLQALVRYHLLLPDTATRRDLEDPATAATVATAVGDRETLHLLAALTEADSLATGPAAWGPWKAGLVARLVEVTEAVLEGRPLPRLQPPVVGPELQDLLAPGHLRLFADGGVVTVAAPDRPGLLATVAGVLTLAGAAVRSASTLSDPGTGMAVLRFEVAPAFDVLPDWDLVTTRLEAALDDRLPLAALLEDRERDYAWRRRASAPALPDVRVTIDNTASASASVVEVRAPDRGPVLYQVTHALTGCDLNITRALVNTLGAEAIDVFYVQTSTGGQVLDVDTQARLIEVVTGELRVELGVAPPEAHGERQPPHPDYYP